MGRSAAKTSFSGNKWEHRYGTFITAAILTRVVAQAQLLAMIPIQVLFQDAAVVHVGSLPRLYQTEQNPNNYNSYSRIYLRVLCHECEKGLLAGKVDKIFEGSDIHMPGSVQTKFTIVLHFLTIVFLFMFNAACKPFGIRILLLAQSHWFHNQDNNIFT